MGTESDVIGHAAQQVTELAAGAGRVTTGRVATAALSARGV